MSYAVIQTGGKQYKVRSGEILKIEKLPNSKLVILDNLKHSILLEAPERVAEQVKKFLLNYL